MRYLQARAAILEAYLEADGLRSLLERSVASTLVRVSVCVCVCVCGWCMCVCRCRDEYMSVCAL